MAHQLITCIVAYVVPCKENHDETTWKLGYKKQQQEAQLPQRNSASAMHVFLGWLTDCAVH